MSNNHSVTKRKRRQKSGRRKDTGAATMAKLKALAFGGAKTRLSAA